MLSFSFLLGPGPKGAGTRLGPRPNPGPFVPRLIWARARLDPGPIWAWAHLGPGPFGPKPIWARACLGPGLFGPGSFPFRDQFRNCAYCLPMPIPMPGPIAIPVPIAYEGP